MNVLAKRREKSLYRASCRSLSFLYHHFVRILLSRSEKSKPFFLALTIARTSLILLTGSQGRQEAQEAGGSCGGQEHREVVSPLLPAVRDLDHLIRPPRPAPGRQSAPPPPEGTGGGGVSPPCQPAAALCWSGFRQPRYAFSSSCTERLCLKFRLLEQMVTHAKNRLFLGFFILLEDHKICQSSSK